MPYQSKTYSLSDEVIAAIDAAKAKGESPNKFLRRVLGIDKQYPAFDEIKQAQRQLGQRYEDSTSLDAVGPPLSDGRGKVSTETRRMRGQGDGKR